MYGLSDDEILAIREGHLEGFAPEEVAILRMADAMADTPSNVSDELYAELRRHFSEEQVIELAASAFAFDAAKPGRLGRSIRIISLLFGIGLSN